MVWAVPISVLHVSHNLLFRDTNLKTLWDKKAQCPFGYWAFFKGMISVLIVFEKTFHKLCSLLGFELILTIPDRMIASQLWYLNPATHRAIP